MTLNGAIKQLHDLGCAEDMPIYYKPAIAGVINVLRMDVQEVRHGRWVDRKFEDGEWYHTCSVCGMVLREYAFDNFCGNCGAKMDGGDENADEITK